MPNIIPVEDAMNRFPASIPEAFEVYERLTKHAKQVEAKIEKLKKFLQDSIELTAIDEAGHMTGSAYGLRHTVWEQNSTSWKAVVDTLIVAQIITPEQVNPIIVGHTKRGERHRVEGI